MQPETCDHCARALVVPQEQSCCPFHPFDDEPVTVGPTIIVCNCEPAHGVHEKYCPSSQRASAAKA